MMKTEKEYVCLCGKKLVGEAASGIEEEIAILLRGSEDKTLLEKAWFITNENRKAGNAFCFYCVTEGVVNPEFCPKCDYKVENGKCIRCGKLWRNCTCTKTTKFIDLVGGRF